MMHFSVILFQEKSNAESHCIVFLSLQCVMFVIHKGSVLSNSMSCIAHTLSCNFIITVLHSFSCIITIYIKLFALMLLCFIK